MSDIDQCDVEFEMLKDFYEHWEKFHALANSNAPKSSKALAAQRMMESVYPLRAYYNPPKIVLNG